MKSLKIKSKALGKDQEIITEAKPSFKHRLRRLLIPVIAENDKWVQNRGSEHLLHDGWFEHLD